MRRRDDAATVYSSQQGRICTGCRQPKSSCACRAKARPTGDGVVRVGREVKGRRGKTVTTISGVPLERDALRELASELKRKCGSGGSLVDGVIEIQGEHRDMLVEELARHGFRTQRAGG